MKTKTTPLALPFALLLSLALAACTSSDDGPGDPPPSGGATAEPPAEPTTSCEYRYRYYVQCGTADGTETNKIYCVDGPCPKEKWDSNDDGLCYSSTRIEHLRTFEGACDD